MKMFRLFALVAALGVGIAAIGCGGSDTGSGMELSETRAVSTVPVERSGLLLTLSAPKGVYKRGETVSFTLTAQNLGNTVVNIPFAYRLPDKLIEDANGVTVQYFPPVSAGFRSGAEETFAPGETKQYNFEANLIANKQENETLLPAGTYRLKAWLGTFGYDPMPSETVADPLTIRVVE